MTNTSTDGVKHPVLPPDYELDDYWMNNIVLKDPKEAEDEFYSAYGHFSLHPLPPAVAARVAAAPPYVPFPKDNCGLGESGSGVAAPRKNNSNEKKGIMEVVGVVKDQKHKKSASSFNNADHSDYQSGRDQSAHQRIWKNKINVGSENNLRIKLSLKKQKITQSSSCSSAVEQTTSTAAALNPPHCPVQQDQLERQNILSSAAPSPLPALTNEELLYNLIRAKMGVCQNLMLVIDKHLTRTDLERGESRFSVPVMQVKNDFLNGEEIALLKPDGQKRAGNIDADFLIVDNHNLQQQQPNLHNEIQLHRINLTYWQSLKIYVLNKFWSSLACQYKLKVDTNVQLWAFRNMSSDLCFALVTHRSI